MKVSFNRLAEAELIAAARYLDAERGLGSRVSAESKSRPSWITTKPVSPTSELSAVRILFDQGTPVPLRKNLVGHEVHTA
jgi:hypothetical protein